MQANQILGCVAGDDTILIVTQDEDCARMLSEQVHDLLRGI